MSTLFVLTVLSWIIAASLSSSYPALSSFVWKEGFFFAGLAFVYRVALASEEDEAISRKYN